MRFDRGLSNGEEWGMREGLTVEPDGVPRCGWHGGHPEYVAYHDGEWGRPVADDHRLFEKICLEGFQAGLSWWTILRKRERFREVFEGFDFERIACFTSRTIERLMADAGIIRHRGKIESTVNNARRALDLVEEYGSLGAYFWSHEPSAGERPRKMDLPALQAMSQTPASASLSRDLKRRGWSFVGPTTVYAFMQAMGMVNDHLEGCHVREACDRARARFRPPGRKKEPMSSGDDVVEPLD